MDKSNDLCSMNIRGHQGSRITGQYVLASRYDVGTGSFAQVDGGYLYVEAGC